MFTKKIGRVKYDKCETYHRDIHVWIDLRRSISPGSNLQNSIFRDTVTIHAINVCTSVLSRGA